MFMLIFEKKQEIGDKLGVCILHRQIVKIKITRPHVIKGSGGIMKGNSSLYITTLSGLVTRGIAVVEL